MDHHSTCPFCPWVENGRRGPQPPKNIMVGGQKNIPSFKLILGFSKIILNFESHSKLVHLPMTTKEHKKYF